MQGYEPATAAGTETTMQPSGVTPRPALRLARKYCFDNVDMDLFFMSAVGGRLAASISARSSM
ncbi:MAG: hypothetical protein CBARDMAM_1491 [uncultured Caballeronia sp.]|nr:MAG: hypothetical protein CBARDMAM_1491 [uncultured Caballeronia sp.]